MSKKILVVDDEPSIVKVVASRLEAFGYEVITANDGDVGLERLKNEKPDLVILDITMPRMDGYTFVKKLQADHTIPRVPIVMLTAKDKMKDLFELEGIKDYIVKPFDGNELLDKVKKHLG
ncbi:MAG: response regulator [Candidatus Omnitrophica bacterium]|nr:response regulator [Candidatus Omnitrophota bacterium]MBU1853215.1 response regulator [Candidatus Omnitrophota bacterium]